MTDTTTDAGTTPLRALHEAAGARFGRLGGVELPRNYGEPAAEYRAAREAAIVVDRSDRTLFRIHGRDPRKMLDGLATNAIADVGPERGVYATLLTAKGRMVAELRVFAWDGDQELLLETAHASAPDVEGHFGKYVPPLFARIERLTGHMVLGIYGPRTDDVVRAALDVEPPADAEEAARAASFDAGPGLLARTRYAGEPGVDVVVPVAAAEAVWAALTDAGARPAGHATLEVLRIEAGRPRWGADLDSDRFPLEAGLRERAISETKGCYTGQEVIIRILHRGHVNWILRRLELGDAPAPAPGTELLRPEDGKTVGTVTSACDSPRAGRTIGLGYVRREVEPGDTVRLGAADGPPVTVRATS